MRLKWSREDVTEGHSIVQVFPCFEPVSVQPADHAVDPPVPCAQSCFLIRMWEHENMDDSTTSKTREVFFCFFFNRTKSSVCLSYYPPDGFYMGNVTELKFL